MNIPTGLYSVFGLAQLYINRPVHYSECFVLQVKVETATSDEAE